MTCRTATTAELVLVAGTRRIAHKRFTCEPPASTVRVRLNAAGRRLLARDDRLPARDVILANGTTFARRLLLVARDS